MIVALVVACAFFMETFTGTVITTALPAMAQSFGSDPVHLSLGVTAYLLSLAIFIPLSGWIADRYGARTVFRAAIGVFTVASVLCGLSNSLIELVAARIVQGVGGALMVPAFLGPVVGPPVGGFITTFVSWRWVFMLNVPIGLLGIVLVTLLLENRREPHARPLDWQGFLLSGVSLACILYSLDLAPRGTGQATACLALLGFGLALGVVAILHARRHPYPLIDLSLLRLPTFALSVWGGMFYRISAGAIPFLLPVFLQVGLGMTAFVAGLLILSDAVGTMAMNAVAPAVLRRWGFRTVLLYNGGLSAAAVGGPALIGAATPDWVIFVAFLFAGLLRSLQYNALSTLQYAEVEPREMSAATSFASMIQQICNGGGIAAGALLMQLALLWRGAAADALDARDIRVAFLAAGVLALAALPFYLRLAADAGAEVSGHRAVRAGERSARSAD